MFSALGDVSMAIEAILFDLDGTLIATNELHVSAWMTALAAHDHVIGRDLIESEIGKGGDLLVPTLLGEDVERREGEAIRELHKKEWQKRAREAGIAWIDGAQALLRKTKRLGMRTALATPSSEDDVKLVEEAMGIKLSDYFDVISSSDVSKPSKPSPNIALAACEKLALDPLQAVFVGDSIFDAKAAARSGLAFIGVRTGFAPEAALMNNGARVLSSDAAALAVELEKALEACDKTRIGLDRATLERMMADAIEIAQRAGDAGEAPVGAALFDANGRRIAVAHDESRSSGDPTSHAPLTALRRAFADLRGAPCILASTLEPCLMCFGAAVQAGVDVIIHALPASSKGEEAHVHMGANGSVLPRVRGGIGSETAGALGGVSLKRAIERSMSAPNNT
jgi:HAD superfamily hydrolase (TIGR01549 family)